MLADLEILCRPLLEQKSDPFVPIRCKGFDRAPGTNWFTFATLFSRESLGRTLHIVKNATHFIHFSVCSIQLGFSIFLHNGFHSPSTSI